MSVCLAGRAGACHLACIPCQRAIDIVDYYLPVYVKQQESQIRLRNFMFVRRAFLFRLLSYGEKSTNEIVLVNRKHVALSSR